MYIDKETELSSAQAVTASAASTNHYDSGVARDHGLSKQLHMAVTVDEAATAAGAATVTFELQCDDTDAFSSPKTVISSGAIGKALLAPGYQLFLPIPPGLDERYFRLNYSVATGPLTAGKFTAYVVEGIQSNKAYPDAV